MKKKVKQFTVKRSKWGRNWLLNGNGGKMCCLGFLAKACGYTDADICSMSVPAQLYNWSEWYLNKDAVQEISTINDSHRSLTEKEVLLKKEFKESGIKISFVD